MPDAPREDDPVDDLRRRAEDRLGAGAAPPARNEHESLVHELRTHQVELEIQNQDLREAQLALIDARDRYAGLYNHAPVGYATLGDRGAILEMNLTLAEMLGAERASLSGRPFLSLILAEDQGAFQEHCQGVRDGDLRSTCRVRLMPPSTGALWVEICSTPIEGESEGEGALRIAVLDITERKRLEQEARALEQQVQRTGRLESLGVLAGGIAHDFNNLLTGILGNVDLVLMDMPADSPSREYLLAITSAARTGAELAGQMLAYSGQGRYVAESLDLGLFVRNLGRIIRASVPGAIRVDYDIDDELPSIVGDSTQLSQLLLNLVANASDAIGAGPGEIKIRVGATRCGREQLKSPWLRDELAEGLYTFLEVTDTGCGIESEAAQKIFEPFHTTKFTGRGLGLAAVLGIVRGHEGTIRMASEIGRGTTFRILLPVTALSSPAPSIQENHSGEAGGGAVLLIDDEETVRRVGVLLLERLGFDAIAADGAARAIEIFRATPGRFRCVLTDLSMPGSDGMEVCREVRRIRDDVPVILTSGRTPGELKDDFADKGFAGFLQKPYRLASLKRTLAETLTD